MSERKNNSWSGTAFINNPVNVRQAGSYKIASSRIAALSRKKEGKFWIDVEAWEELAEKLEEAGEGARIDIQDGYFTTESWEDKNTGEKRYKNVLTITEFEIIEAGEEKPAPKGKGGGSYQSKGNQSRGNQRPQQKQPYRKESYGKGQPKDQDDDIPF